jgi:TPM domain
VFNNLADAGLFIKAGLVISAVGVVLFFLSFLLPEEPGPRSWGTRPQVVWARRWRPGQPRAVVIFETPISGNTEIRVHLERRAPRQRDRRPGDVIKRARDVFHHLGLHRTGERHAVLIYLALEDRRLAIVGDQGIHGRVGDAYWGWRARPHGREAQSRGAPGRHPRGDPRRRPGPPAVFPARCRTPVGESGPSKSEPSKGPPLQAAQMATVTPHFLAAAINFGISGGPTGTSWSIVVNSRAAWPVWPVTEIISPPPGPKRKP